MKDKIKIELNESWNLKRAVIKENRDGIEIECYSIQLLDLNNVLTKSVRITQNIVIHHIKVFEDFGVYKNKKGERIRFYVYEHMLPYFLEKLKEYKYTTIKKVL